jgi:hypothetical protein
VGNTQDISDHDLTVRLGSIVPPTTFLGEQEIDFFSHVVAGLAGEMSSQIQPVVIEFTPELFNGSRPTHTLVIDLLEDPPTVNAEEISEYTGKEHVYRLESCWQKAHMQRIMVCCTFHLGETPTTVFSLIGPNI